MQYWRWLSATAHGNLGQDISGAPITDIIKLRIPATVLLIGISYLFQEMLALPLGLLGALKRYSIYDQVLTFFSYVGLSLPTFWLGLMLILSLADKLRLVFPPGGITNPNIANPALRDRRLLVVPGRLTPAKPSATSCWHLVLPALTLAIIGIGGDSRFMRASMLDVINQDYIRTARAKGLPQSTGRAQACAAQRPAPDHHQRRPLPAPTSSAARSSPRPSLAGRAWASTSSSPWGTRTTTRCRRCLLLVGTVRADRQSASRSDVRLGRSAHPLRLACADKMR